MVLHIYRGWWCLKDQRFLSRLIALQDDAEVACNGIVSISVGEPYRRGRLSSRCRRRWTFLSGHRRRHLDELGLREVADTVNKPRPAHGVRR